ncbi:hypothetical protein [Roseateles sp.]|uniref:hypothetical protein n=1 Tax=Roseateles sp. TaxID=1971397 RepID=UPI0031D03CDC
MTLYAVHIPGPDELFAAPSLEEAERVAAAYNAAWRVTYAGMQANSSCPEAMPSIESTLMRVVRWPHSEPGHKIDVMKWCPEEWGVAPTPEPSVDDKTIDMFGGAA